MNIVLLGPPGCGKGTQGAILAQRLGTPKVATGDLLRTAVREGTELGVAAKRFMDQGLLVPDEVVLGLIEEELDAPAAAEGIIMDGFPRTVAQAEAVDAALDRKGKRLDHVLSFDVDPEELVRRMTGRAAIESRSDDTPEAFRKRLQVYGEQTAPLIAFYADRHLVTHLSGEGSIDEIAARVREAVGR